MPEVKILKRDPVLKPSENGGYIVQYDKCCESNDKYEGISYLGRGEEIFEDGPTALARLDEIQKDSTSITEAKAMAKMSQKDEMAEQV